MRLPVTRSQDEITVFFSSVASLKQRTILMTGYAYPPWLFPDHSASSRVPRKLDAVGKRISQDVPSMLPSMIAQRAKLELLVCGQHG
ncbi:hypothetical protein [Cupriavidus basilensis]|uniref:hypothetical protein n=1 Tax=Cupriavidus basilensis TaxID=68895 RepID=UPI0039F6DF1B